MPYKPSPNQFGQIVTCVAAARLLVTRLGCLVEFGSFKSHYRDEITRARLIDSINILFDAQHIGDGSLSYLGNVFGHNHLGNGVIIENGKDGELTYTVAESYIASSRVQHMSVRNGVRRVQNEMSRFGSRLQSKAFNEVKMDVDRVGDGLLHIVVGFDGEVSTGFHVSIKDSEDDQQNIEYAADALSRLATSINSVWPSVIGGYGKEVATLDESSGINELRKVNPLWGTW